MAASSFSAIALFTDLRRNPIVMSSSSSVSFPSSFGRRRNHLRSKILKTLIKPYPTPIPSPTPPPPQLEPLESPDTSEEEVWTRDVEEEAVMKEDGSGSDGVENEVDEYRSEIGSEVVAVDRFPGKLDMKVVGLYGLGLFVLQALCAVFIFGSAGKSRDHEDEDDEFEIGGNENSDKGNVVLEDAVRIRRIVAKASETVNVDEPVLVERIAEIRVMARNARDREAEAGCGKSDDEGDAIQREVSNRLVRMQKMLGSVQNKSSFNHLSKEQKESENSKEMTGKLVFPKKKTFRNSIPTKPMNDAKGFSAVTDLRNSLVGKQENIDPSNSTDFPPSFDGESSTNDASSSKEDIDKKLLRMKALELKRKRVNQKADATKTGNIYFMLSSSFTTFRLIMSSCD